MRRRPGSLFSALCLLTGPPLIAIGWWDHWNPYQINQWLIGERIYPFYWQRFALTLGLILPVAYLAWWLSAASGPVSKGTLLAYRCQQAAWGFSAAFAIPFILGLKYGVTWLGINYGSSIWTYAFILVLSAIIAWLMWPLVRNPRVLAWLDRQAPMIILTGMVIYAVVYGGLSIARHASFRTYALELGSLDQAVWNTSRGRLLEYTPLPVTFGQETPDLSPDSRLVGGKLELILLPLSLLYWLWADPRVLIALQAVLLASGAIPLYHLARMKLQDSAAALAIVLAYLLYLPLHLVAIADFHASALLVPFLLWAWQAAEQGRWRSYYLAVGIALLCRVDAALALLGLGVYFGLARHGSDANQRRRHGVVTFLLGLAWLALDFGLVSPWAKTIYGPGTNGLLPEQYGQFGQPALAVPSGPGDAPGVAQGLLAHPVDELYAWLGREKLQALVDLLATLGWTPLLAPLTLLSALPVLALNLSSATPGQNPMAPYFAAVIPFLFVAALQGAIYAGRWITRLAPQRDRGSGLSAVEGSRLIAVFALTTTLMVALFLSPLPPGLAFTLAHYYQVTEHEQALANILELVPAQAVVSAQSGLFPHLSRRPVIYLFPTVADAEYVALDLDYSANKTPVAEQVFYSTVDGWLADPTFHVAAFDKGVLLLRRGAGQNPPAFQEALAGYRAGLYHSALVEYRGPRRLRAEDMVQAEVVLENRGTQSWETVGPYPIYLSYHWWTADGDLLEPFGLPTALGQAVKPGETLIRRVRFLTPAEPGRYVLEWDLVHERRTWFGDQGGITLRVDVTVE